MDGSERVKRSTKQLCGTGLSQQLLAEAIIPLQVYNVFYKTSMNTNTAWSK